MHLDEASENLPIDWPGLLGAEADWLESLQIGSGAIVSWSEQQPGFRGTYSVNPYFADFAALGLLAADRLPAVHRWIGWYVGHRNRPDVHGLSGTVYDFEVDLASGTEHATGDYDSVDSYASTFLNLVLAYWRCGTADPATADTVRGEVLQLHDVLLEVAAVIDAVTDRDGLTWAKPGWMVKYLMDNCEVYSGLADAVTLWELVWPDEHATRARLASWRDRAREAILTSLCCGDTFSMQLDQAGTATACSGRSWYPHATASVYPALWGVITASDPRAVRAWDELNRHFPGWPELDTGDSFPWAIIGYAAVVMGDLERARRFLQSVHRQIITTGRPAAHWYCAEAGWVIRIASAIHAAEPAT